jgi:hypothetical protein
MAQSLFSERGPQGDFERENQLKNLLEREAQISCVLEYSEVKFFSEVIMGTFKIFSSSSFMIPSVSAIYLSDLGEARGRQELYTRQSPQKLKALKEHALIESAVSSNRIEGVTIERSRVATVVFGKSVLKNPTRGVARI